MEKKTKTKKIMIRMSEADYALLVNHSKRKNMNPSEFLRYLLHFYDDTIDLRGVYKKKK